MNQHRRIAGFFPFRAEGQAIQLGEWLTGPLKLVAREQRQSACTDLRSAREDRVHSALDRDMRAEEIRGVFRHFFSSWGGGLQAALFDPMHCSEFQVERPAWRPPPHEEPLSPVENSS